MLNGSQPSVLRSPLIWDSRFMAGVRLNREAFVPVASKPRAFTTSYVLGLIQFSDGSRSGLM